MKRKKVSKKLALKKETIADISDTQLQGVKGGQESGGLHQECSVCLSLDCQTLDTELGGQCPTDFHTCTIITVC